MSVPVTIVDYGSGNLFSVMRALEHCGAAPVASSEAAAIESADRLLLPGVGAFADGMQGLRERGLVETLRRYAASGRPLLGICLGMQLLASSSDEFGHHEGLGVVPGRVVAVPAHDADGTAQKIPHIGWAEMQPWPAGAWAHGLFAGLAPGTSMYLVHSFHLLPDTPAHGLAVCHYGGHRITAAVQRGNTVGVQFHPEKSGPAGLRLLRAFVDLPGRGA